MSLSLSNLQPNKKAFKKRKRVGRGNASGHGTYSTRGLKGQKSRSGVTGLKRLGMKKQLLAIPKKRGFTSFRVKPEVINLHDLNNCFKDGALVNPKTVYAAGLTSSAQAKVKLLSNGELKVKNLKLVNIAASAAAADKIKTAGGRLNF